MKRFLLFLLLVASAGVVPASAEEMPMPEMVGVCENGDPCYSYLDCDPEALDFCIPTSKVPYPGSWINGDYGTEFDNTTATSFDYIGNRITNYVYRCEIPGTIDASAGDYDAEWDYDYCIGDQAEAAIRRGKYVMMKLYLGKRAGHQWHAGRYCKYRSTADTPISCTSDTQCQCASNDDCRYLDNKFGADLCMPEGPVSTVIASDEFGQKQMVYHDPDWFDYDHGPLGDNTTYGGYVTEHATSFGDYITSDWGPRIASGRCSVSGAFCSEQNNNAVACAEGAGTCEVIKTNLEFLVGVQSVPGDSGDGSPGYGTGVESYTTWKNAQAGISGNSGVDGFNGGPYDGALNYPATAGEGTIPRCDPIPCNYTPYWWGEEFIWKHWATYRAAFPERVLIIQNYTTYDDRNDTELGLSYNTWLDDYYGIGTECAAPKAMCGGQLSQYGGTYTRERCQAGIPSQRSFRTVTGKQGEYDTRVRHEFESTAADRIGPNPWWHQAPMSQAYWTSLERLFIGQDWTEWRQSEKNEFQNNKDVLEQYQITKFYHRYAGYKSPKDAHGGFVAFRDGLDTVDTERWPEDDHGIVIVGAGRLNSLNARAASICEEVGNGCYMRHSGQHHMDCDAGTRLCGPDNLCVRGTRKGLACNNTNALDDVCYGCRGTYHSDIQEWYAGWQYSSSYWPSLRMWGICDKNTNFSGSGPKTTGVCTQGADYTNYGRGCGEPGEDAKNYDHECDVNNGVTDLYGYLGDYTASGATFDYNDNFGLYVTQIDRNSTKGWWRIGWDAPVDRSIANWPIDNCDSAATCQAWGRFARSFGTADGMYFNVNNDFWYDSNSEDGYDPNYTVWINVKYYDEGGHTWKLRYEGDASSTATATSCTPSSVCDVNGLVTNGATDTWKEVQFEIADPLMNDGGGGTTAADFWLEKVSGDDAKFHMVEIARKEGFRTQYFGECSKAWLAGEAIERSIRGATASGVTIN